MFKKTEKGETMLTDSKTEIERIIRNHALKKVKVSMAAEKLKYIKNSIHAREFLSYLEELLRDGETDIVSAIDAYFEEIIEEVT